MADEDRLQQIISAMSKAALADGKITEEEQELLESAQINIMIYEQALEDALEDGIITQEELDVLNGLKQQILNEAWDIAQISDGISDDEIKMLQALLRELEKD